MEKAWRDFLRVLLTTAIGVAVFLYAAVLLIDPYDILWFSPPLDRAPVTTNQRFSFPALAGKSEFDSAVIGTSMTRLLNPQELDAAIGGHFVNLSMNSGTAYEQTRMLDVFARHHPQAATVIFGIDGTWCEREEMPLLTPRPFPEWMYDESRWNDLLYHFNLPVIEEAGRQFVHLTGIKRSRNGRDGYTNFLPPREEYDLARVQRILYGEAGPRVQARENQVISGETRAAWRFPTHEMMQGMLAKLAPETRKILMFVPYHRFYQPVPGSEAEAVLAECKRRLTAMAEGYAHSIVLDFMIESEITQRDENYWDNLHYSDEIATRLAVLIGQGLREKRGQPGFFAYLGGNRAP